MSFAGKLSALAAAAGACLALGAQSAMAQQGIEVRQLGAVDPFEVDGGGALPSTVWSSGEAAALRAALTSLPESNGAGWSNGPAARLALRALLSAGEPPEGAEGAYDMAAMRAGRALSAGRAQQVQRLLVRTPATNQSTALSRLLAETSFALGEISEACRAADALLEGRDTPYWLRARAACLAFDGNMPAAELTAELARAQAPNPEFDALFEALVFGDSLPNLKPVSGLQLAIAARIAPETRIEAGAAAPSWLARVASRTGPRISLPDTLPEALEAAVSLEGADRAAALGALIGQDLDREIAAEALAIRLADAREAGEFLDVASAYGSEVARLPITGDTLAHGVIFTFAALAADDVVAAGAWREALIDGPPRLVREMGVQPGAPLSEPTSDGPSDMTQPPAYSDLVVDEPPWTPPAAGRMVAIDFARAVAEGQIEGDGFAALMGARIEGATPARLCQAAGLAALGAEDDGAIRAAMTGLARENGAPAPVLGPMLLAASAQALGETQLLAANALEQAPDSAEVCAAAALSLDRAGLRGEALRLILEQILAEAA
ncbi:hypothetical protein ACWCOP_11605 [Maricaulaceae bacterium MS644]